MNQERRIAFLSRENERLISENNGLREEVRVLNDENKSLHDISAALQKEIEDMEQVHSDAVRQHREAAHEANMRKEEYDKLIAEARLCIRNYEKKFEKLIKRMTSAD